MENDRPSVSSAPGLLPAAAALDASRQALPREIARAISEAGGWIGFDRFMALALYAPGLGYYSRSAGQIGRMPSGGSDFITAPELSPAFGATLAVQVAEALAATGTREIWEFGAGTGALAEQLLDALDALDENDARCAAAAGKNGAPDEARGAGTSMAATKPVRYTIVDLSAGLAARQRERLARFGDRVRWVAELPARFEGVVVGNEVLDAMPVRLLVRIDGAWWERGVGTSGTDETSSDGAAFSFAWSDRPTALRPPVEIAGQHDYLTEMHPQAEAFVATLGDRLTRGAVLLIDYGFPAAEYYHPQRDGGTVMCHQAHRADADALVQVGDKDITAHVDFTGMALAAQDAGLDVLGYTSQGRFLLNCGFTEVLNRLPVARQGLARMLVVESEMGELFKVLLLAKGASWNPCGFVQGDRTHRL